MKRVVLAFSALMLATHAQAAQKRLQAPALDVTPEEDFPVPPIPPTSESPYLAAPVPNTAIGAPQDAAGNANRGASLSPGFYQPKDYNLGEGYLNGSTIAGEQERRAQPMPRLQLKMPLQ